MTNTIAIIDYQMGNLRSVQKGIEHAGGNAIITSDPSTITGADKVILPGVGAFGDALEELQKRGLVDAIHEYLRKDRPFLGICLGMQLLFEFGDEGGRRAGLGIIPGEVVRFVRPQEMKVPHMGWNTVHEANTPKGSLLSGVEGQRHFYFVHSFYAIPTNSSDVWFTVDYGGTFCAAVSRGNLYATQFHPEKSQANGLQLLKNFVNL